MYLLVELLLLLVAAVAVISANCSSGRTDVLVTVVGGCNCSNGSSGRIALQKLLVLMKGRVSLLLLVVM